MPGTQILRRVPHATEWLIGKGKLHKAPKVYEGTGELHRVQAIKTCEAGLAIVLSLPPSLMYLVHCVFSLGVAYLDGSHSVLRGYRETHVILYFTGNPDGSLGQCNSATYQCTWYCTNIVNDSEVELTVHSGPAHSPRKLRDLKSSAGLQTQRKS